MLLLIRFSVFLCFITSVAENSYSQELPNTNFCIDSIAAEFPGGPEEFVKYLKRNLQKNLCIDLHQLADTLVVMFTIGTDGAMREVSIFKGINNEIDAEVVRLIYVGPNWKPAKRHGRGIEVRYTLILVWTINNDMNNKK
jgi:hypothetical protein